MSDYIEVYGFRLEKIRLQMLLEGHMTNSVDIKAARTEIWGCLTACKS